MMIRTRFRPSANGRLHFGGAAVARENWNYAKSLGGQFVLLVDDVNPIFKYGTSAEQLVKVREYGNLFAEDLTWLGYPPDIVAYASDYAEAHFDATLTLSVNSAGYPAMPSFQRWVLTPPGQCAEFTYHEWLCVGRVTDDHELGISGFVRGADLMYEAGIYDLYGRMLYGANYDVWQQYYPIVVEPAGNVCSKSDGTEGIHAYRELGVTPAQILEALQNPITLPWGYGRLCTQYVQVDEKYLRPAKAKK